MPVQNTQGGFSTGRDCSVVIVDTNYGQIQIPNATGFNSRQQIAMPKVDRMDGVQLQGALPKGWSGSFSAERADSGLDDYFAQAEENWFANAQIASCTIYQYVTELDGSVTTYEYDNVCLTFDDAGNWRSDQSVKQNISFQANRRRKL
jgi:hypothetical protein